MTRIRQKSRVGLVALAAFALAVLPTRGARSDDVKAGANLSAVEGTWSRIESKNGRAQDYQKLPEGTQMIKCVTGGRFIWTMVREGRVIAAVGGKYTVDKDKYTESIEYIHGAGVPQSFVGSTFEFTRDVDGDTWHKVGTIKVNDLDYKVDEKWERCK